MKTKWMRLVTGSASGIALAATLVHSADLQPMVVQNITGILHIVQKLPCDTVLTRDTPITRGRIVITPAEGFDVAGGKSFTLTGFTISFAPFTISASDARRDGVFNVTIPKDDFLIFEAAIVDGRSSERGFQHPSEDVTGTIDLTRGTVAVHVVVARSIHFKEGCSIGCVIDEVDPGTLTVDLSGPITFPDVDRDGVPDRADNCRLVANPDQSLVPTPTIRTPADVTLASCADHHIGLAGAADICDAAPVTVTNNAPSLFAVGANVVTWTAHDTKLRTATDTQNVTIVDTTPPTVTCVPGGPPGGTFQVSAFDACDVPVIRLGTFVLANGERIKIEAVGKPGVTLINDVGPDHLRHFHVGKGENVITATDASHNVGSAICK